MRPPRDHTRCARSALLSGAACYFVLQLALTAYLEARLSEVSDREFRDRLVILRQRAAEQPGRPLLFVVGSSRITTDFLPEALPPLATAAGERPLPFNLSHSGSGPLLNLLLVRRMIREGFTPRWLVVEVFPPLLAVGGKSTAAKLAQARDLATLRRYISPGKLCVLYAGEHLAVSFTHRDVFLRQWAPWLLWRDATWDVLPLDDLGGSPSALGVEVGAEEVRRRTAVVGGQYFAGLQQLAIHDVADRAMRELLKLCRERHIEAVLLLTPESSEFRGWYSPESKAMITEYCARLSREYDVPVVDARTWLADAAFLDGHHALPAGARAFTLRLGRQVLRPLVARRRGSEL